MNIREMVIDIIKGYNINGEVKIVEQNLLDQEDKETIVGKRVTVIHSCSEDLEMVKAKPDYKPNTIVAQSDFIFGKDVAKKYSCDNILYVDIINKLIIGYFSTIKSNKALALTISTKLDNGDIRTSENKEA